MNCAWEAAQKQRTAECGEGLAWFSPAGRPSLEPSMHEAAVSPSPDLTPELQVVRHLVATRLERSVDEVVPAQRLMSDLRLGLLGLAVLALEVEDVTGVLVPFDALTRAVTVEDLARALHAHRRR